MTKRVIAAATDSILTSIYRRYFNVSICGTLVYLSAVLSGILCYFEYLKVMLSKYLSAVLFEVSICGTLEVSIGGAFEYQLARYPLYRNIWEGNGQTSDTGMIMINAYWWYFRVSIGDTFGYLFAVLRVSIGGTFRSIYWQCFRVLAYYKYEQHMYVMYDWKTYECNA